MAGLSSIPVGDPLVFKNISYLDAKMGKRK